MTSILVRDVPPDVHAALQARAAAAGTSLQQYVRGELARIARQPTMAEVVERISSRTGGTIGLAEAVAAIDAERARAS